jgi:hypothetical protein
MKAEEMLERMASKALGYYHSPYPGGVPTENTFKPNQHGLKTIQAALRELVDKTVADYTPEDLAALLVEITELEL